MAYATTPQAIPARHVRRGDLVQQGLAWWQQGCALVTDIQRSEGTLSIEWRDRNGRGHTSAVGAEQTFNVYTWRV